MMQSPPSSHLSSWTCLAGCDHTDPGPPVCGAAPLKVCVNLPWITTPSYAAVCQCQPESMPAGNFCRISEAPSFGFPHTANICSPGCFGSTGFHGMASLVVKVPWVTPAFAPAAGVAPVPRSSCANAVRDISAAPSASFANCFLNIFECLLSRCTCSPFAPSGSHFLNFKLPVESSTQSQPLQDVLLYPRQGCEPTQNVLSGRILDDCQRNARKRFQDPLRRGLAGH